MKNIQKIYTQTTPFYNGEVEDDEDDDKGYVITQQPSGYTYTIDLYGSFYNRKHYNDILYLLRNSTPNDTIYINCSSSGGRIDITEELLNGIQACESETIGVAYGSFASACTFIFLACDSHEVYPNCSMMLHTYSSGLYGKGQELASQFEFLKTKLANFIQTIYRGFLTEEEITKLMDGHDYWFKSEEIVERLNKRKEFIEKEEIKKLNPPKSNKSSTSRKKK